MANLQLEAVSVDFPIYNATSRSLKNSLMHKGTGGRIGRDTGNRVCVRAIEDVSLALQASWKKAFEGS
ncbi:MAG: ABC transporter ATP-binding protein, partial [Kiloniellaceae bacterium]